MRNELSGKIRDAIGVKSIDDCHLLMRKAAAEIEEQAAEIAHLKDKVAYFREWKVAMEWKAEELRKEIARLKCQIELTGNVVAYAEFASNGNIRMWTKPESATPEQRKVMVPLAISAKTHYSDCAIYNEPAYPAGDCNCGGDRMTDQLRADHDELIKTGNEWYEAYHNKRIECDALAKDAARYRWLRENGRVPAGHEPEGIFWVGADADAAIDAAMKGTPA